MTSKQGMDHEYLRHKGTTPPTSPMMSSPSHPSAMKKAHTKAAAQRLAKVMSHKTQVDDNDDDDDDDLSFDYNPTDITFIGLGGGRKMQPPSPMKKPASQAHKLLKMYQPVDDDTDRDDNSYDYGSASGVGSIGRGGARSIRPSSPMGIHDQQDQPQSTKFTANVPSALSVKTSMQPLSASPPQSTEEIPSSRSVVGGRLFNNSIDQPSHSPIAGRTPVGRPAIRNLPLPSSVPRSLRTAFNSMSSMSAMENRKKRLSIDLGGVSRRHAGNLSDSSALQDEIDMLQEENESLLDKLRLAEERYEEAEARVRQLEKQISTLGEGVTLEARLLIRKEAALQQREAALKVVEQTNKPEEVAALRMEAEAAKDEAMSALEQLRESESEAKSLRNMTQRMILTKEEMEEVVLKRCWLAWYWNLCVQHGIHSEIASIKYEYWSSFAPLPFEIVIAAGQRAIEDPSDEENDDAAEREKIVKGGDELSGEGNIESMLLVEKGLKEMATLKLEDAVAFAMAQKRRPNLISDDVKLTSEGQFEAFELSQEESDDVRFKQAWLTYFWRRAKNHGVEADIADERLQFWISHSNRPCTSHDAVDVERGLLEMRKLGIENRLWLTSRKGLDTRFNSKKQIDSDVL